MAARGALMLILIAAVISACASAPAPQTTQLQIREFQTRAFEVVDTKLVMKALLNVLQDEGFIVKNAVVDLGLISATKELDIESKSEAFWARVLAGQQAVWKKNSIVEATVNVTEFGK